MNYVKFVSIFVVLFGFTLISSSQTLQEVVDARNRGANLMGEGKFDEAIAEFEKSIEIAEAVGEEAEYIQLEVESALPNLYLRKAADVPRDNPAAILEALQKAIEVAEKFGDVRTKENAERQLIQPMFAVAMASYQAENYDDALVQLDAVIAQNPNHAGAHFVKGVIYENNRDVENMDENFRLAIAKGREFGDARSAQSAQQRWRNFHYNAGVQMQRAQRWDDAILAFTTALEADENHFESLLGLAIAQNAKRNWDDAIAAALRAIEIREDSSLFWELGVAYQGKNDRVKACESLRKVTDGPRLENAKHQIEHVLRCN